MSHIVDDLAPDMDDRSVMILMVDQLSFGLACLGDVSSMITVFSLLGAFKPTYIGSVGRVMLHIRF